MNDSLHVLEQDCRIGIAWQVQQENHLGFGADYGLKIGAKHDHAIVLVDGDSQKIVDETSVLELKTDASNCKTFPIRARADVQQVRQVDLIRDQARCQRTIPLKVAKTHREYL